MSRPPVISPVDYDAWSRGYTPPAEHILIDQLMFRGASVCVSMDIGKSAWWFVVRGKPLTGKRALAVVKVIEEALDAMAEEDAAAPPSDDDSAEMPPSTEADLAALSPTDPRGSQ